MKKCPECGANVEGLLYRCDCCGANLSDRAPFLIQHVRSAESGDFSDYVNRIVDSLEQSVRREEFAPLSCVVLELYCFPQSMILKFNMHKKHYVSLQREKAILTDVVCADDFALMTREQKEATVAKVIDDDLLWLRRRLHKTAGSGKGSASD